MLRNILQKIPKIPASHARQLSTSTVLNNDGVKGKQVKGTVRTGRVAENRGQSMEEKYFREMEMEQLRKLKEKQKLRAQEEIADAEAKIKQSEDKIKKYQDDL